MRTLWAVALIAGLSLANPGCKSKQQDKDAPSANQAPERRETPAAKPLPPDASAPPAGPADAREVTGEPDIAVPAVIVE